MKCLFVTILSCSLAKFNWINRCYF